MAHYDGSYKNSTLDIHGLAWGLVKDCGRRITEVAGKKGKRCATKHAEVGSVKYVEYCKGVKDHYMNSKIIEETLERLNIIIFQFCL